MISEFYIPRTLMGDNRTFSEAALLGASNVIVVLAEPGAGKTELMCSLARQLGINWITASVFSYCDSTGLCPCLVIDAFDELAKIDHTGLHKLLSNVKKANPSLVIVSSRSSEWSNADSNLLRDFLGQSPLVVRLSEFDELEQKAIFEQYVPNEDFAAFQTEVARFELEPLLPNPQFLKLFADAYIESGRRFTDKPTIFSKAVERLAKEANSTARRPIFQLSTSQKVKLASEVFTKILLSGAEGVCTHPAMDSRMYPSLGELIVNNPEVNEILATRLFKPSDNADEHRPVHKIVAEYCAGDYLVQRITDPGDPLTLAYCLPIIAPNSIVRDELRGLIGWMGALGTPEIEEAVIKLDAYAVLANGDPSQLSRSSKVLLIKSLKVIEDQDPLFRRGDYWRRFSVAGFFSEDIVQEIKPLLAVEHNGHLRTLVLDLLDGSPAVEQLVEELRFLVLSKQSDEYTRVVAGKYLIESQSYDLTPDLEALIEEGSLASLKVASRMVEHVGGTSIDRRLLVALFQAIANCYATKPEPEERIIGEHYFVKTLIASLDQTTTEWLLDVLTENLACSCGKEPYDCHCRNGVSKVAGTLLDRYFELAMPPFNAIQIWRWIGNLHFHDRITSERSLAVKVLQDNDGLRQEIIAHVFQNLENEDQIKDTKVYSFEWHVHAGLAFQRCDYEFIVDLAFKNDNSALWASFLAVHNYYANPSDNGPNLMRRHMRSQANQKPEFMRKWASINRANRQRYEENLFYRMEKLNRRMKRRQRKKDEVIAANKQYFQEHRELVESGQNWSCLFRFAQLILNEPEKIEQKVGDATLVQNALKNCFDFISPYIPSLQQCAELHCASRYSQSHVVLYAACLVVLRAQGHLKAVDPELLKSLRTNLYMGYNAVSNDERKALQSEIDDVIFQSASDRETYLRQYIEPQLAQSDCSHPDVGILRYDDVFSEQRKTCSIEWLQRFPDVALTTLNTLFETAVRYGNREELTEIIEQQCARYMAEWPQPSELNQVEDKRNFWLLRAFYFLNEVPQTWWDWLQGDKNTVLQLNEVSDRYGSHDYSAWPKLNAKKVMMILGAFVDQWPKVPLPNHWGSESPNEQKAYRFLTEIIWLIAADDPENAVPVALRLLSDPRFSDLHRKLKSIHSELIRKKGLRDFEPPSPQEIVQYIDRGEVVTVEGLRQLVIQTLDEYQSAIKGGEFNPANRFYENDQHLAEVKCSEIIAERLSLSLEPQNIEVILEKQMKNFARCDIAVSKILKGQRRLLVTEVKGQWHGDLYSAASSQLNERYSIHPDAEQQGIYLVIWFGEEERVAGIKTHGITNAGELKRNVEARLPPELQGFIDVFVLDVSRSK